MKVSLVSLPNKRRKGEELNPLLCVGHPIGQTTLPIRVAKAMGAKTMIVTNAAGGINRGFQVGDIMMIIDHINFLGMSGNNPLVGPNEDSIGPRFPQLTDAYNADLREKALDVAKEAGITLQQGVFVCQSGPFYETPAELRFLRAVGADAAGMSTANEVVVARHAGLDVLGFSNITNVARLSPDEGEPPSHEEVLEAANIAGPKLLTVIKGVLKKIGPGH
jgi:purine-nucleoside phosphorylase